MKSIPIIIPGKQDETPITLSLPKLGGLDRLAKVLISSGIGLALAGAVSSLLDKDDEKPEIQTGQDNAQSHMAI